MDLMTSLEFCNHLHNFPGIQVVCSFSPFFKTLAKDKEFVA